MSDETPTPAVCTNPAGHESAKVAKPDISKWTRAQFDALPERAWDDTSGLFYSVVILPTRHMHDSGYRRMDVALIGDEMVRVGGCPDVLHLDGIGGYGEWRGRLPDRVTPSGWSIDCLPTSGLLRLFTNHGVTVGAALSSLCIYAAPAQS